MKAETLLPLGKLDPGLRAPEQPLHLHEVTDQARLVDQLGYHALLMEETKDDPFQVLALAAAASERVHIGTSVAIAFARDGTCEAPPARRRLPAAPLSLPRPPGPRRRSVVDDLSWALDHKCVVIFSVVLD